ncbi:MAG: hypothetical protein LLG04_16750 [Parachlamydia sp.]|nr:hypothetical protein [Parachlamydia sp.]
MSQIKQIIPENLHRSALNQLDRAANSNRPSIEKAALLLPLSGAVLITNVAAAASESLHLLGQLCLAGAKYGAIGTLRVLTWSNACESLYKKLPDGKSLIKTFIKICKLMLGIFYSLLGLAVPGFNLRRQEELGHFIRKHETQPSPEEKPAQVPQPPKEEARFSDRQIKPLILENKKAAPKSRLKQPLAKQKAASRPTRRKLAKVRMNEFLKTFQNMKLAKPSLPQRKVHFAPEKALVQVRPIPTRRMEKELEKQKSPQKDLPAADVQKKDTSIKDAYEKNASGTNPGLVFGTVAGVGTLVLAKTAASLNNPASLTTLPSVNSILTATQNVSSTLAAVAESAFRDVVAPTLVATLANVTEQVVPSIAPALLSQATVSNATALAAPALSLAQMVAPAAVSNGTCSIVASAANALAAPAMTIAQIVNGNAPIMATELAKQLPMSWTSIALVVGTLAIKGWFPMAAIVYNG